jgi:hypothetical protein
LAGSGTTGWERHYPAAAFDTRLGSALAGGAGYGIADKLQGHGYGLVKNPEGFILEEAHGPLHAGEIERAKEWGAQLVRASVGKNGRLLDLGQVGDQQRVVPPVDGDCPSTSNRISVSRGGASVESACACVRASGWKIHQKF